MNNKSKCCDILTISLNLYYFIGPMLINSLQAKIAISFYIAINNRINFYNRHYSQGFVHEMSQLLVRYMGKHAKKTRKETAKSRNEISLY